MRILPNSTFKIYQGVHVDDDVTIVFRNKDEREEYFARHRVSEITAQVIKKTGQLKFPLRKLNGVSLDRCNYISFQNPAYDDVIYYARIIQKDYVNNETALIMYSIDRWLTRMFDVSYNDMAIDREHTSMTEWTKLQSNPYDQTVLEMRTPEQGLIVTEDLQKRDYQLGNTLDCYMVGQEQVSQDKVMYHVLYLSPINFGAFQEIDTGLNQSLWSFWTNLMGTFSGDYTEKGLNANGFVFSPDSPTAVGNTGVQGWNTKWQNLLAHPYWVIGFYIKQDGTYEVPEYSLPVLLEYLNQANLTKAILSIYSVPEGLLQYMAGLDGGLGNIIPHPLVLSSNGQDTVRSDYSGADPKLFQFPFAYLKLTTPNGDSKEYKYEDFLTNQRSNSGEVFALTGDLAEQPKIIVQPNDYKIYSPLYGNPLEAVVFSQFPTVPYTLDAWTAQMAAMSAEMVQNYNLENAQALWYSQTFQTGAGGHIANIYNNLPLPSIGAESDGNTTRVVAPGGASIASGSMNSAVGFLRDEQAQRLREIQNEEYMDANNFLAGQKVGNAIAWNYRQSRPAYAVDIYNRSNGDGVLNYNVNGFIDILLTHVRLAPATLRRYTKYFDHYGYRSMRYGIPHVLGYSKGNDEPAWRTIDGKKCTYIRTVDAKVFAYDSETAHSIKNMLDSGIRMLKGDELP